MEKTQTQTAPSATTQSSQSSNATKKQSSTSSTSSGKKQKTLEELLEDGLKDIYSAETQLVEALPKMAQAAYSEDLQDAILHHLQQTKRQVERLEKAFSRLGIQKNSGEKDKCQAMEGLIAEGKKIIEEYEESPVRDSAIIIGAQKIEHYEIAAYGSLCELADVLGHSGLHDLLGRTLDEEEETDMLLSELASEINDEALESSESEEEYAEEE